jgi:hypothetical protein
MGYSHYWTLKNGIEQSDWDKFLEGARLIIATAVDAGIPLEDNSNDSTVSINGVGAGAHEDFVISIEDVGYDFCKTAEKPYDTVATALLIHLKQVFGSQVLITSDGAWHEWDGGKLLYETVFDIQPEVVFE